MLSYDPSVLCAVSLSPLHYSNGWVPEETEAGKAVIHPQTRKVPGFSPGDTMAPIPFAG